MTRAKDSVIVSVSAALASDYSSTYRTHCQADLLMEVSRQPLVRLFIQYHDVVGLMVHSVIVFDISGLNSWYLSPRSLL